MMPGGATQAYLCPTDAKWADSLHRRARQSKACQYFTADSLPPLHHSLSKPCQYATADSLVAVFSFQLIHSHSQAPFGTPVFEVFFQAEPFRIICRNLSTAASAGSLAGTVCTLPLTAVKKLVGCWSIGLQILKCLEPMCFQVFKYFWTYNCSLSRGQGTPESI